MSAGCAFSSNPQVLHFSQALGGHASGQERGGLAAPVECPGLSVDGGEQGGRSPCELMADDGGGTNRSTWKQ